MKHEELEYLRKLCEPIVEYIGRCHSPYTEIVISDSHVKIKEDIAGIPNKSEVK